MHLNQRRIQMKKVLLLGALCSVLTKVECNAWQSKIRTLATRTNPLIQKLQESMPARPSAKTVGIEYLKASTTLGLYHIALRKKQESRYEAFTHGFLTPTVSLLFLAHQLIHKKLIN